MELALLAFERKKEMQNLYRRGAENAEEAVQRKTIETVFSFSVLYGPLRTLRLCG